MNIYHDYTHHGPYCKCPYCIKLLFQGPPVETGLKTDIHSGILQGVEIKDHFVDINGRNYWFRE